MGGILLGYNIGRFLLGSAGFPHQGAMKQRFAQRKFFLARFFPQHVRRQHRFCSPFVYPRPRCRKAEHAKWRIF